MRFSSFMPWWHAQRNLTVIAWEMSCFHVGACKRHAGALTVPCKLRLDHSTTYNFDIQDKELERRVSKRTRPSSPIRANACPAHHTRSTQGSGTPPIFKSMAPRWIAVDVIGAQPQLTADAAIHAPTSDEREALHPPLRSASRTAVT